MISRLKQFERFQQFRLARTHGPDAPKLVDHIILAEFDIDTGSTVRHKYPTAVPGYTDDWFAEYMLPEGAHNHSLDWTVMFLNKGKAGIDESMELEAAAGSPEEKAAVSLTPFLYCINLVRKKDDPTVRRGAIVKAMAVCSRYHFIEMFRPLLIIALDQYYQTLDPQVLANLYNAINAADIASVPRPQPWERRLMRRGETGKQMGTIPVEHLSQKWTHTIAFEYGTQRVQAVIPLHTTSDETLSPSVTQLLSVFGPAVMRIYSAVVTGQRVLFVGYNHAAGDVCKIVLAACAMAAPPLKGTVHRALPYANLSDLSFLEVPGFIAGVTNPMFESHLAWWDLLCQLDLPNGTGTVLTADEKAAADDSKGKKSPPRPPARVTLEQLSSEEDAAFIQHVIAGVGGGMSEAWVRAMFRDYTQALIDQAVDLDSPATPGLLPTAATAAALADDTSKGSGSTGGFMSPGGGAMSPIPPPPPPTNTPMDRINVSGAASPAGGDRNQQPVVGRWRLRELKKLPDFPLADTIDPWRSCEIAGGYAGTTLRYYVRRLQLDVGGGVMEDHEVREAFEALDTALQSEASLQILLGMLPETRGGIFCLGCGLLHTDARTREKALSLHRRLASFDSTRPAVQTLNAFFAMTYMRST